MANYRSIHVKFWNDGTVEGLKPNAKLLMLYFITNPYRNESGLYSITTKRMSDDTGLNASQRDKALAELQEKERVFYDPEASVVWVVNAIKHLAPNDNCKKSVRHDIEYCPSQKMAQSLLFYYHSIGYQWVTDGMEIGSEPINRVHGTGYRVQGVQQRVKKEVLKKLDERPSFDRTTGKLTVPPSEMESFCADFDRALILQEIPRMERWLRHNEPKKDFRRFMFNWLNKATQQSPSVSSGSSRRIIQKPCQHCHDLIDVDKLVGHELNCKSAPPPAKKEAVDKIVNDLKNQMEMPRAS